MDNAKPMGNPMHSNSKLDKGETEKDVDETRYRGIIGSLMYLTSSRPNIVQSIDDFSAVGYCDVDFASDRVDRRSTSGLCCFLGKSLNVWSTKKQPTVALSTAEAEYIAASSCCSQLMWDETILGRDIVLNNETISDSLKYTDVGPCAYTSVKWDEGVGISYNDAL
ncbi:uncharacterized mitochondrial protein AtMg00810-like [Arachis duranensis]|uniref:Uncharacterized mitochondrial protein AtMg00810-like n=1 Tax=Arachis duranensis TaxID=130453 RepID=A0A6P4C1P6_ARADU|nr:uncharacterized mitochondrial protein AtMg00810-like [Arachis duranensis]